MSPFNLRFEGRWAFRLALSAGYRRVMGAKYIRDGFHHVIPAQVGEGYKPPDNSMRKGLAMVRVWGVLDVILQDLTPRCLLWRQSVERLLAGTGPLN